jgi:predicted RNA binding protein YcfA (HicA-like mRNA interferase family)
MPRLPRVSGAEAIRALGRLGFAQVRQRGSHVVLKQIGPEGVTGCVVPLHAEFGNRDFAGNLETSGRHDRGIF